MPKRRSDVFGIAQYLRTRSIIKRSHLFDASWYRTQVGLWRGLSFLGLDHFILFGARLGFSPSRHFNLPLYLQSNPDVAASGSNALLHYLEHGQAENRPIVDAVPVATSGDENTDTNRELVIQSGLFDPEWYLENNPDLIGYGDLLEHFLNYGGHEGRSSSPEFDTTVYLSRNNDVKISGTNPLIHYIVHGRYEGRSAGLGERRLAALEKALVACRSYDHHINDSKTLRSLRFLPTTHGIAPKPMADALHGVSLMLKSSAPAVLIIVPWLVKGGADLVALNTYRALEKKGVSACVVVADYDRITMDRSLIDDVMICSFASSAFALAPDDYVRLVSGLINGYSPTAVININSAACWEAYRRHGKHFSKTTRLYAMLFCRDYNKMGYSDNYADRYLRPCLEFLFGLISDNKSFLRELTSDYAIPESYQSRLYTIYQPQQVEQDDLSEQFDVKRRKYVLWASRICDQKNISLLMEIVALAPHLNFIIAGEGDQDLVRTIAASRLPNIRMLGAYDNFDDLPVERAFAFLYTSKWDGLPNVLLHAAAHGLPIVAPIIGGIGELVSGETGFPVSDSNDPRAYIDALDSIRSEPRLAKSRIGAMQKLIAKRHSWETYVERIEDVIITVGDPFGHGDAKRSSGGASGGSHDPIFVGSNEGSA